MADGEPFVSDPQMFADTKFQAGRMSRIAPGPDNIALRAHGDYVPGIVLRIPHVEVVVMNSHAHEVFGSRFLIEPHQVPRIEPFGFPERNGVLKAELRGMAVSLDVIVVLLFALQIHIAGIPVAGLDGRLRSPVGPDAKLRISKPLWRLIFRKRLPGSLKGAFGNFEVAWYFGMRSSLSPSIFRQQQRRNTGSG